MVRISQYFLVVMALLVSSQQLQPTAAQDLSGLGDLFGDNFTLSDLGGLLDGLGDISIPGFEGILGGDANVTSILDGIQDVVSDLLNGTSALNISGLLQAVQDCDVEAWIPLGEACTAAQQDSQTACPDECKQLFDAVEKDCPGLYSSLGVDGNLSELCESVKDEEIEVDQPEPLPEPLPQAEPLPQPEPVTVPQSTETQTDDATPESTTQSSATKTAFHVVSSLIAIAIFINA